MQPGFSLHLPVSIYFYISRYKRIEISHQGVNPQFACAGLEVLSVANAHLLSSTS